MYLRRLIPEGFLEKNTPFIEAAGGTSPIKQEATDNYLEILHSLAGTSGVSAQARSIYTHEIMVTDRLRDAITEGGGERSICISYGLC